MVGGAVLLQTRTPVVRFSAGVGQRNDFNGIGNPPVDQKKWEMVERKTTCGTAGSSNALTSPAEHIALDPGAELIPVRSNSFPVIQRCASAIDFLSPGFIHSVLVGFIEQICGSSLHLAEFNSVWSAHVWRILPRHTAPAYR